MLRIASSNLLTTMKSLPYPSSWELDRVVFDSGSVRIGAFRCEPHYPSFHNTGPATDCCFVFPRTAVEIQHEHEPAFVANPNVVTFYNRGQVYLRNAISPEGDRCDWFGISDDIAVDMVRSRDPRGESRPEQPFRFTRTWSDPSTYLLQRRVFSRVVSASEKDPLAVEECVLHILETVVEAAYNEHPRRQAAPIRYRHRDIVRHIETVLSTQWSGPLTLRDIAGEVGLSPFHICRLFRQATGTTLHQYRRKLRLRGSLEGVLESKRALIDIALDSGFTSHSHFTQAFHREFAQTPSGLRRGSVPESRALSAIF